MVGAVEVAEVVAGAVACGGGDEEVERGGPRSPAATGPPPQPGSATTAVTVASSRHGPTAGEASGRARRASSRDRGPRGDQR